MNEEEIQKVRARRIRSLSLARIRVRPDATTLIAQVSVADLLSPEERAALHALAPGGGGGGGVAALTGGLGAIADDLSARSGGFCGAASCGWFAIVSLLALTLFYFAYFRAIDAATHTHGKRRVSSVVFVICRRADACGCGSPRGALRWPKRKTQSRGTPSRAAERARATAPLMAWSASTRIDANGAAWGRGPVTTRHFPLAGSDP